MGLGFGVKGSRGFGLAAGFWAVMPTTTAPMFCVFVCCGRQSCGNLTAKP